MEEKNRGAMAGEVCDMAFGGKEGRKDFSLPKPFIEYFDCELPHTRRLMQDAEGFLDSLKGKRIVLDEIHRLSNPSELLKIAADYYLDIQILATGSSTLAVSAKFKDTLTGRKRELWLTPMNLEDIKDFDNEDMAHRFFCMAGCLHFSWLQVRRSMISRNG